MRNRILLLVIFISVLLSGCNPLKETFQTIQLMNKDEWTITQHGPREINMSFYTIHNPMKGLIVVDGGWTEDAPYVREVINSYGGHVDAWILTHPHQDHIGAFNALFPELNEISISEIYTVDMPSPEECLNVAPWDSMDVYNDFLEFNIPEIKYVYPDDILEIKELKIEILSTYDDTNCSNIKRLFK